MPIYLGYRISDFNVGKSFRGAMDEVALYSRALSEEEVAAASSALGAEPCTNAQNQPPLVDAGSVRVVSVDQSVQLEGFVTDDEYPIGAKRSAWWTLESGPSGVIIESAFDAVNDAGKVSAAAAGGAWSFGWKPTIEGQFTRFSTFQPNTWPQLDQWRRDDFGPYLTYNRSGRDYYVGSALLRASELTLHPASDGALAVARWTAPKTSRYLIEGYFVGRHFTTTDVEVVKGGRQLWSGYISGQGVTAPFYTVVSAEEGETVDFQVGRGNGESINDSTGLAVHITPIRSVSKTSLIGEAQVRFTSPGRYTFRLHGSDSLRESSDQLLVIAFPKDMDQPAPGLTADAGPDQSTSGGAIVRLNGSGSVVPPGT
ncbi:MAG: hypothetical protein EBU88_19630, partial [Acidobacteria bacterium]|nr:hypothetical protein [Acidobacteriota bacterium]